MAACVAMVMAREEQRGGVWGDRGGGLSPPLCPTALGTGGSSLGMTRQAHGQASLACPSPELTPPGDTPDGHLPLGAAAGPSSNRRAPECLEHQHLPSGVWHRGPRSWGRRAGVRQGS